MTAIKNNTNNSRNEHHVIHFSAQYTSNKYELNFNFLAVLTEEMGVVPSIIVYNKRLTVQITETLGHTFCKRLLD